MNNPKISVLIPAYNHGKYIRDTIQSVLNQTFPDFELLITDDCSTDDTARIIRSFSDKRITGIFFDENKGTVRSLNYLLSIAKGEYIAVLGSDDVWEPDKLEKQINVLESDKNIAACFTWATIIDQDYNIVNDESKFLINIFNVRNYDKAHIFREFFIKGNCFCHSSVMIRKEIHDKIGKYNPAYRQLHDFDLWVRLLMGHEVSIIETPLVKYRFVENSGNVSQGTEQNNLRLYNEAENIILYLFENISNEDFLKSFSMDLVGKNVQNKAQIICEKFFLLRQKKLWLANNTSLALNYLLNYLDEDVICCFENEYGITLKEIYDYTAIYKATCCAEIYAETNELRKHNAELMNQINEIYNSKSWKVTRLLRAVTNILRKMKGD